MTNLEHGAMASSKGKQHLLAIKHMRPIIKQWAINIDRYCRTVDDDAPYFDNERPNLSLLASAAWQHGIVALEEYHTEKESASGRGRTDLFLQMGGVDGLQIEAKQQWMREDLSDKVFTNRIRRAMKSAWSSARQNTESKGRIACVFYVSVFPESKFPEYNAHPDKLVRHHLNRFIKTNVQRADFWAWCFPNSTRTFNRKEDGVRIYYPGVLLAFRFGRRFKWQHS